MNYNPSTIARIGDIALGLRVDTSVLNNATYFDTDNAASGQTELFNVYGRVYVNLLFIELITAASANATTIQFNTTFTTPVIALNAMGAASGSISGLGAGTRIFHLGNVVATAAVLTDSAGLTAAAAVIPQIVGLKGGIGTIGCVAAAADQASGTFQASIFYYPMSDGAYVTAVL